MPTMKTCPTPGCPALIRRDQRCCTDCARMREQRRGSATSRGYGHRHRTRFRAAVLDRDPICVVCDIAVATVADHYPRSRRELEALGLDPDDPTHGRGLCHDCHSRETAVRQPGGWHQG